jgi:hypothetical protein
MLKVMSLGLHRLAILYLLIAGRRFFEAICEVACKHWCLYKNQMVSSFVLTN